VTFRPGTPNQRPRRAKGDPDGYFDLLQSRMEAGKVRAREAVFYRRCRERQLMAGKEVAAHRQPWMGGPGMAPAHPYWLRRWRALALVISAVQINGMRNHRRDFLRRNTFAAMMRYIRSPIAMGFRSPFGMAVMITQGWVPEGTFAEKGSWYLLLALPLAPLFHQAAPCGGRAKVNVMRGGKRI